MDELQKRFPFLKPVVIENTSALYCEAMIREKRVLVSQRGTQWILTVDGKYVTVSVDLVDPIIDTLNKIQTTDVPPNGLAIFLSEMAVQKSEKEHPYPGVKARSTTNYPAMPCDGNKKPK